MEINVNELMSGEEVSKRVKKLLEENLAEKVNYALCDAVDDVVKKFVKEEIVPAIIKDLKNNKKEMLKQFENSIVKIVSTLAEGMVASATKHLEDDYHVKDVIKKIFNIY